MSTEQNPHRDAEPVQPTVEIPTPTAASAASTSSTSSTSSPPGASASTASADASDVGTERPATEPSVRTGPRSSTVVWGFVVVAVALGLLARAAGASVDAQLGAIVLLAVAGVLLVVTSVVGAARRRSTRHAPR